jgi:hypothetical protein
LPKQAFVDVDANPGLMLDVSMTQRMTPSALICAIAFGMSSSTAFANDSSRYIISSDEVAGAAFKRMEVTFKSKFERRVVEDGATPGPSGNDAIYGHGKLWDLTGETIGRFDASTRLTEVMEDGEMRMGTAVYKFGDGENSFVIIGSGKFANNFGADHVGNPKFTYAITGGTGEFLGASGKCDVTRVDKTDYDVACKVLVPKL